MNDKDRCADRRTAVAQAGLRIGFVAGDAPDAWLARDDTLAVFGFGARAPAHADPRYLRVGLEPDGPSPLEVWRAAGPVRHGRDGALAWSSDGTVQFGAIEVDEPANADGASDLAEAARQAYARLREALHASECPHLLRTWNYVDALTVGEGDDERYRRFCAGRVQGWGPTAAGAMPAATAIGRVDGARRLQLYWLSAREPGRPLGNPLQVEPWHYPRHYGPQAPTFARAMLPAPALRMPLLLSGTAAILGHASQHPGDVMAQLDVALSNVRVLLARAHQLHPQLPADWAHGSCLKVYVRDRQALPAVSDALQPLRAAGAQVMLLHGHVCRRELAVEIDGSHDHA